MRRSIRSQPALRRVALAAVALSVAGLVALGAPSTAFASVNSAPVGVADGFNVEVGHTLTVAAPGLLANDTDADGDKLKTGASLIFPPNHGTITLTAAHDGGFTYKPAAGYLGPDSFYYYAVDSAGAVSAATKVDLLVREVISSTPAPVAVGTPAADRTLTANTGTWSPTGVTLSYQWLSSGFMIIGATSPKFTLTELQAGQKMSVRVTGSKPGIASVSKTSAETAIVTTVTKKLTATPVPVVTGTLTVGSTLTAKTGAWSPAPVTFSYQWQSGATTVVGATSATYTLTAADIGKSILVFVTGSKAGYSSVTMTSATVVPPLVLTAAPVPTISGTTKVGSTLTATAGIWKPSLVTLAYQWKRGGVAIAGATSSTHKLVAADAGKAITVTVTGSKPLYPSVAKTSAATAVVKP